MADEKDLYNVEPDSDDGKDDSPVPDDHAAPRPDEPAGESADDDELIDLDAADEPRPASPIPVEDEPESPDEEYVRSLDVCANCGAPMRGLDNMVCLRCGWDMRTGKVAATKTGVVEVDDTGRDASDEEAEGAEEGARLTPLSESGRGNFWTPLIMGGTAIVLLVIGYLSGAEGLYPESGPVSGGDRFLALFQSIVVLVLGAICGVLGLSFLGWLLKARLGDLPLAAARMAGIIAAIMCLEYINLGPKGLERMLELVVQAGAFWGLSMLLFRLSARDAATLTTSTIIIAIGLRFVSWLVSLVA